MGPHFLKWIGLLVISMPWTLISERATIIPQVITSTGVSPQYQSLAFGPPLMADSSLTLLAAKSTQVDRMVIGNEERLAIGGTPFTVGQY